MSRKRGINVAWSGIIMKDSSARNTIFLPLNLILVKAYADIDEMISVIKVVIIATLNEFK
ncbi:hypothetical protein D3C79_1117890 [compost metagenome]